ncbi:MAG: hypothetical protein WA159_17905 [Variovorax sp.]
MGLFSKKQKSGDAASRATVVIASDEAGEKSIAFGVTWRSIASRNGGRQDALKIARAAGGTHLTFKQQQYGYGVVPADVVEPIYPAAQVAARQHGGDGVYAIKIFPGEYWLAVIRGGQPSSIDRVINAETDLEIIGAAQAEIAEGLKEEVHYTIYTNIDDHGLVGDVIGLAPEDLLLVAVGDEDVLEPIPKSASTIPKPVLYALLLAILAGIGNKGWDMYQARERARLARLNVVADEPPQQAWARATAQWASEHSAAARSGLVAARVALGKAPVVWGGWWLETATCDAGARSASERIWTCSARYVRPETGKFNRDMEKTAPEGWRVQYQGLGLIVASWSFSQPSTPFRFDALEKVGYHQVETVSRLQRLQPAFSQVGAISFTPVVIPAPKRKDGTAVPIVDSVPQISEGTVAVKGPLRSLDALIADGIPADWNRLSISYVANFTGAAASLKSSAITADARGAVFAAH